MAAEFHLSIPVRSLEESVAFFENALGARVTHRDPSGYVNLDLYGTQITLQQSDEVTVPEGLHFGVNLDRDEFDRVAAQIMATNYDVVMAPKVVDAGTPLERTKMYVRCPAGWLIELKGRNEGPPAVAGGPSSVH